MRRRIASLGITEVVSSPLSPWQNPYVERVIGSIRRECLDHVIILNERHLRSMLRAYLAYYHRSRTHLGLSKDAADGRTRGGVRGSRWVESRRSAVAARSGGAKNERRLSLPLSPKRPSLRFFSPLIEPDVTIWVIRLSDEVSRQGMRRGARE